MLIRDESVIFQLMMSPFRKPAVTNVTSGDTATQVTQESPPPWELLRLVTNLSDEPDSDLPIANLSFSALIVLSELDDDLPVPGRNKLSCYNLILIYNYNLHIDQYESGMK